MTTLLLVAVAVVLYLYRRHCQSRHQQTSADLESGGVGQQMVPSMDLADGNGAHHQPRAPLRGGWRGFLRNVRWLVKKKNHFCLN